MLADSSNVTFRKVKSSIARIFHGSDRSGAAEQSGTAADRFAPCLKPCVAVFMLRHTFRLFCGVCRVSPDDGSGYNSEVIDYCRRYRDHHRLHLHYRHLSQKRLILLLAPNCPIPLPPPDTALRSKATPLTAAPPPLCAAAACKQEHAMLMAAVMMI
jgi:hypothetical protein